MSTSTKGPESRLEKRYACCGPVKVTDPKSHILYPAIMVDISLSGCALRLRRGEVVAMEKDAEVELHFTTSYFSFRVLGSVRDYSEEEMLVRIKFVQLNQRGWSDIIAYIRDQHDEQLESVPKRSAHTSAAA